MAERSRSLFRQEAIRHLSGQDDGDVLRLSPRWTRWAYWLLIAAFVAGGTYCALGRLYEYASGPAVVWVSGRIHVTATVSGTVSAIDVRPGQRVAAGELLARFHAAPEMAELTRLQREFDLQLVKTLRDPSDEAARQTLTALRTQRDLAAAQLEQLSVRAPEAGVIGDVRIRPGQRLSAGDIVFTLAGDQRRCSIMAMLPAQYRPQLRPGMTMRFEVTGYRYAYQELTITSVSAQVIGPGEVKRYLGQEIDDTLKIEGPVVLVEATPPSPMFQVDGQSFDFYHGMNGTAEARVRSESILVALIPALRVVFEKIRG
jgi:membrane fusion protein (multidrug efflux system)